MIPSADGCANSSRGFKAKTGASILFSTEGGSLQNVQVGSEKVFIGSKVIAITNSSGVASVTMTLPGTAGTVQVSAEGPTTWVTPW
jgi:hypothetical protein